MWVVNLLHLLPIFTTQPPTLACKMEAQSEHVHIACTFLARSAPDLHAQSAPSDIISASELRRKFIKGALLVGYS